MFAASGSHDPYMTQMAATPMYGKRLQKSSSPEPVDGFPRNLASETPVRSNDDPGLTLTILRHCQIL